MYETTTDGFYIILPETEETLSFLKTLVPLRAGLYLDPALADPWCCDADRCRPYLGKNLCCKVQTRCRHFEGNLCAIHEEKPFSCALFPVELLRIGKARVVLNAKEPLLYQKNWGRYDRDMLRCFDGEMQEGAKSMFDEMEPILAKVFTLAELELMRRKLAELAQAPPA